jgi:hypothetical protein
MRRQVPLVLVCAFTLMALEAAMVTVISTSPEKPVLQDERGIVIAEVLPASSSQPASYSRRYVPTLSNAGRCDIDTRVTFRPVSARETQGGCDYCYFIPGPYGCHDSICYDSLCQYVGVCAGCEDNYFEQCSGCAQDRDCNCCQ